VIFIFATLLLLILHSNFIISISVINVNVKFIYSLAIKSSFLRILKLSDTKLKQRELIIAIAIYYFILFHARNVYFCIPT